MERESDELELEEMSSAKHTHSYLPFSIVATFLNPIFGIAAIICSGKIHWRLLLS